MTTADDRITRLEVAYDFLKENMATKEELALVAARIEALDARLTGRMDSMEARLDARMDSLEARLTGRMDSMEARFESMEARLESMESRLLIKFGTLAAGLAGLIIIAQRFWT